MGNKIYVTIAECMGTDGEFTSEVYLAKSEQEAGEMASSLMVDMAETMSVNDEKFDPTRDWSIGNDDWWYKVRVECLGDNPHNPSKFLVDTANDLYDASVYGFDDRLDKLDFADDARQFVKHFVKEFNLETY